MKELPELPRKKSIVSSINRLPEMVDKKFPEMPDKEKTIFKIEPAGELPSFPKVKKQEINFKYPLIAPYAYAHLYWDPKLKEVIYRVEEPELDKYEKKVLNLLEDGIQELVNISYLGMKKGGKVIEYLEKNTKVLLNELRITLSKDSYLKIMYYIYRDFVGLNRVEPLMNDYFIEDIECNGVKHPIYVVHRKYRNLKTNVIFNDIKLLASFVEKLAERSGQYVSYATPLLDGALPDGSRVNATFTEDISSRGPTFTIRKFTRNPWPPTKLINFNTVSSEILAYLWMLIEHEKNVMLIGGTASGKTTFLNALTFFIPPSARIVSIEDTRELNLEHSNWLPSVAREGVGLANLVGQKYGEVSLFNLLKESFRQNPNYVIVGEIRGKEAYVLFQGMASGHPSFGTMHANSVDTMIKRLETEPINLSGSLVETMDVVLVMASTRVKGKDVRRLKEVVEIISIDEKKGNVLNKPFIWNPGEDKFVYNSESHIFKQLVYQLGMGEIEIMEEWKKRTLFLNAMTANHIFDFHVVQGLINEYYKDPEAVLDRFGIR
ncbi:type II/IV secretion system ATPase subunit [archaeon]|nr:type II/IV secretion system ATPase subunit [archaeon]